ncbi:hypothetical protein J2W54_001624 [Rhodococcus fascians]|uniref:AvrD family protein n=1 Tax=Nocardiaceae TaxID=85025 RepID=UPI0028544322|nr:MULTISPECIES: AvrD family protein [Rhodococcus]MDR6910106.1 hypothetical protein [Rhodococcus sp. 3258]MDR6931248.1 hypothetical protein [Rhodococcus fascians]
MSVTLDPLALSSADVYLGSAERRFFGDGYRRSSREMRDIAIQTDGFGHGTLTANAAVSYPKDWSRKGQNDQAPHLSTVDVIALGEEMISLYLVSALRGDPSDPSITIKSGLRVDAGITAVEDDLSEFPLELIAASKSEPGARTAATSFICHIGKLRLDVTLEHPFWVQSRVRMSFESPSEVSIEEAVAQTSGRRCFATDWAVRRNVVNDIAIDRADWTATARPATLPDIRSFRPADAVIDSFVVTLQVGQILLYELDSIERASSQTLWMRHTSLTWPAPGVLKSDISTFRLEKMRLLEKSGHPWRVADVVGDVYGVTTRCSVAHQLP